MNELTIATRYFESLANMDYLSAEAAKRQLSVYAKRSEEHREKQAQFQGLVRLAEAAKDTFISILDQQEDDNYSTEDVIDFLEQTVDDRSTVCTFIDVYNNLANEKPRLAHRRFLGANEMLEKVAATNQNPSMALNLFKISCAKMLEDTEEFLKG